MLSNWVDWHRTADFRFVGYTGGRAGKLATRKDSQIKTYIRGGFSTTLTLMSQDIALQLTAIREISQTFLAEKIDHWLFGGWAVDFAVGRITRPHDDVDFVVWDVDTNRVEDVLRRLGFARCHSRHPKHQQNWKRSEVKLQTNLVRETAHGLFVSPGAFEDWPWLPGSFGDDKGKINDTEVRIVSPAGQLEAKENFPRHPSGRQHRAKDISDIKLLRKILFFGNTVKDR